jgi:hypothetical protein
MIYRVLKGKKALMAGSRLGRWFKTLPNTLVGWTSLFLVSEAAGFITSEHITVKGGLYVRA